jgi:hypothetical protein
MNLQKIIAICEPEFNFSKATKHVKNPQAISKDLLSFFKQVFVLDPNKRLKFAEVYQHPLI